MNQSSKTTAVLLAGHTTHTQVLSAKNVIASHIRSQQIKLRRCYMQYAIQGHPKRKGPTEPNLFISDHHPPTVPMIDSSGASPHFLVTFQNPRVDPMLWPPLPHSQNQEKCKRTATDAQTAKPKRRGTWNATDQAGPRKKKENRTRVSFSPDQNSIQPERRTFHDCVD